MKGFHLERSPPLPLYLSLCLSLSLLPLSEECFLFANVDSSLKISHYLAETHTHIPRIVLSMRVWLTLDPATQPQSLSDSTKTFPSLHSLNGGERGCVTSTPDQINVFVHESVCMYAICLLPSSRFGSRLNLPSLFGCFLDCVSIFRLVLQHLVTIGQFINGK